MAQQPGAPEQEAQATPTPEQQQQMEAVLRQMAGQGQRRGRQQESPQVMRGDPKIEGQQQVEQVEQQILRTDYNGRRKDQLDREQTAEFKGKMQREFTPTIKNRIEVQTEAAKKVRKHLEVNEGRFDDTKLDAADVRNAAHNVTIAVSMLSKAMERGYITPPTHEPTKLVLESLARKINRYATEEYSSYLQPLLNGILNETDYIRFSEGDELTTKFERDLRDILSSRDDDAVKDILDDVFTEVINQDKIPGINLDRYRTKIARAKQEKKADVDVLRQQAIKEERELHRRMRGGEKGYNFDLYIEEYLDKEKDVIKEAPDALELFRSLESADKFFEFYKKLFFQNLDKVRDTTTHPPLSELKLLREGKSQIERAAKDTTEYMHKLMIYTTHLIFTPVLEGDPNVSWQESVQRASEAFANPENLFRHYNKKFAFMIGQSPTLPGELERQGIPFFNFGQEEKNVYMPQDGGIGKIVRKRVTTSELKKMESFKEFVERMHIALETERDLLEAGINYNFLLLTGTTQEKRSFFDQAAQYAKSTLQSHHIDELYHLPYHELIHAAKIQLSSYFKKRLALNDWIKDPSIFHQAFDHNNKIQRDALLDLIKNFAAPGTPEWAIRRAFFHARMHLSLFSQEFHAYAGYGHPNLTRDFKPSYTDPALKNMETYNTWYNGQQWQVPDTFVQNMAFLAQPGRAKRYDKWMHEDHVAEGRNIFQWKHDLGDMALAEREYFKKGIDPNIFEFNPLKIGGVEQQGGYRLKYPSMSWVFDKLDHTGRHNEHLKMKDDPTLLTDVWKRLENLGVDILKHNFRNHWMLGYEGKGGIKEHLKQKADGTTDYDGHWEDFSKFLFKRYFDKDAIINRRAFNISFFDDNLEEKKIDFSTITSEEQFWNEVVKPILHRKAVAGEGETAEDAGARNNRERAEVLQKIVDHALTVMTFERLPMDFVFMENPSRSQNGMTLIRVLKNEFIKTSPEVNEEKNNEEVAAFEHAIDDILFVQERARDESIRQMNSFVKEQNDKLGEGGMQKRQTNIFAYDMSTLQRELYSDVRLIEGSDGRKDDSVKGYRITEKVVRYFLNEKYTRQYMRDNNIDDPNNIPQDAKDEMQRDIDQAVNLFNSVQAKITEKPEENMLLQKKPDQDELKYYENLEKLLGEERIIRDMKRLKISDKKEYLKHMRTEFEEAQNGLLTRAMWSGDELLSGKLGIGLNDMAYPFLDFSSVGQDMVFRTIDQIKDTQEMVYNYISGGKMLSDLKKYYRKEDKEALFEDISEIRTKIKIWLTPSDYNGMAMRLVENAMNVMRINSDAEDNAVELAYMASHKLRSAFSGVVKEGPEYPLRRENRYAFIDEFLHYAQFSKRANPEDMVYDVKKPMTREELIEKRGWLGGQIAAIAGQMFGKKEAKYVREQWKELSGIGLRSREFATVVDLVTHFGPTFLALLAAALMILLIKKGSEESEQ